MKNLSMIPARVVVHGIGHGLDDKVISEPDEGGNKQK
jgi:hypothetical protein